METHSLQPAKKQAIILAIIALLIISLSCKSPDVVIMVYDNFFGPENTREAKERNSSGTENAIISTRVAEQNTLHAAENNRAMTAQVIRETQYAIDSTLTNISFNNTAIAQDSAYKASCTAYAHYQTAEAATLAVSSPRPVIDAVRFPPKITTGELATGWIDFHDYNGDVNRVRIDAVRAESWTTMQFYPSITKGDNTRGTIEFSFT